MPRGVIKVKTQALSHALNLVRDARESAMHAGIAEYPDLKTEESHGEKRDCSLVVSI